jgi:DNA-binding CsgD family transcriptional regulator
MVTLDEFSRLVAGIYAAAATPADWDPAIRDINRAMGGNGGALLTSEGPIWSIQNAILPPTAASSYADHYCRLDHTLANVKEGPVGLVRTGAELILPYRKLEFYAGWLHPYELEDALFVRLTGGPTPTCMVMHTSIRSERFDTPERVKLMNGLVMHLQQALRTQNKLSALADYTGDLTGALEVLRHGIILVGPGCRAITVNRAAEEILNDGDGLQYRTGRITATNAHADVALHRALRGALMPDGSDLRGGRTFSCNRPSGKSPYVIHVLPLHRVPIGQMSPKPTALVLIIDPEHEPEPARMVLRRLYGLTIAEAEVALGISRGASLKVLADELSVSYQTVRTHLQHIFDKTDTHRQSELVRLLLALSA